MTKVSLTTGQNRRRIIRDAVDVFTKELRKKVTEHARILIKPDIRHFDLQLAATHIDALRGVLDALRAWTDAPIVIADASEYGAKESFRRLGLLVLEQEYGGVRCIDLQEEPVYEELLERDGALVPVRRSKLLKTYDVCISVSSLKTHSAYGAALSVAGFAEGTWIVPPRKTAHGQIYPRTPWLQAQGDQGMHKLLADLYAQRPADFAVIDGVLGMEGDGPIYGNPVSVGVALAGMDPVAVDAVGAVIMGIDPQDIGYLRYCADQGCGIVEMAKIDVPPLVLTDVVRPFTLPEETKNRLTSWMK